MLSNKNKVPISPYSVSFYNSWKINPSGSDYNIVLDQQLDGEVRIEQLDDALKRFVLDNSLLNSHIKSIRGKLYWIKNNAIHGLEYFENTVTRNEILRYIQKPFDLQKGPLYRFGLIKQQKHRYRFIVVLHNVLINQSLYDYFVDELSNYYNNKSYQHTITVEDQLLEVAKLSETLSKNTRLNYKDNRNPFWSRKLLETEPLNLRSLKVISNLDNTQKKISLPLEGSNKIGRRKFSFNKKTLLKLNQLANKYKVNPYSYGWSIFAFLLSKYTRQNKFYISQNMPIKHEVNFIHGAQIDFNIIYYDFSIITNIIDVIHQSEKLFKVYNCTVLLNKKSFPVTYIQQKSWAKLLKFVNVKSKINQDTDINLITELSFEQSINSEKIICELKYRLDKIDLSILNGFLSYYKKLFTGILDELVAIKHIGAARNIREYNLPLSECYKTINRDNNASNNYTNNKTIHAMFEEQVERTPNSIALIYKDKTLTYKELNRKANQLANYILQNYYIKGDMLVALCLDRDEYMLIAILAILKVGGTYVPIDPNYPNERINYILKDTNAQLILTNQIFNKKITFIVDADQSVNTNNRVKILTIDANSFQKEIVSLSVNNLVSITNNNNLAYIIYTSGTTGNPKGVMIEHKGVLNTLLSLHEVYDFTKGKNVIAFTEYIFDVSVSEFFTVLFRGGILHLIGRELKADILLISEYIIKNNINYIYLPPALLSILPRINYKSLYGIIYAGEPCAVETGKFWSNNYKLYNYYGPTEITIYASGKQVINGDTHLIGLPISNTKCYILDNELNPLPVGAIGELYIGGVGLARGYLNRPDLTAEKFIANPFQNEEEKRLNKNSRIYKTGDLVRWLPDGNLEYIGRNDFQVKIRGYRIELGEIENVLLGYKDIKQSVVLVKGDSTLDALDNKYLVSYYVSENKLDEEEIRSYLYSKLPEYMIPSILVHLRELPLTINGKLDRKALPDPEFTNKSTYVAPCNELEEQLCQIWADVLNLPADEISIHDDFFRLGGNSILAIKLANRFNRQFNSNINVSLIFKKYNNINKLVNYLENNNEGNLTISKIYNIKPEEQILSFGQERLWFIEQYEQGTNAYNIPMVFRLSTNTNLKMLERSIKSIVSRHEILRTVIKEDSEGNHYQLVLDEQEYQLKLTKMKVTSQLELESKIRKQIDLVHDLSNEYPIKACLYELANKENDVEYYISIIVHHIAFDGWSIDIFLRELQTYYNYYLEKSQGLDPDLDLPVLTIQYKDFALWQKRYLTGDILAKQLNYWRDKLEGYETLNLITDKPRPNQIDYAGNDIYFSLDENTSIGLRKLAKELDVSLYSVLLSGYCLMLRAYSNQDDIVIGTPIANRHYNQIEELIGFFVNSLALRIRINSKALITDFIKEVGEEVINAQLYQDLPFEKLVEELKVPKDTSRHPIFQVLFAVQNFESALNNRTTDQVEGNLINYLQIYPTIVGLYNPAKLEVSTYIDDSQICLKGNVNYAINLYNYDTINGLIKAYTRILQQMANVTNNFQKQIKVADLYYLNREQHQQIIEVWNSTDNYYLNTKTIHTLFEKQAQKTPNNIALIYKENKLTYKEINIRANQLSHYLKELGVRPGTLIAITVERSLEMFIGLLGILKAGGAYVPLDPNYPIERLQFILEDTQPPIILTNKGISNKIPSTFACVISLDTEWDTISSYQSTNPISHILPSHLAYIIYTSGTTGKPKGVMIEHASIINTSYAAIKHRGITTDSLVLSTAPYVFDSFVLEFYPTLLTGALLHVMPEEFRKDINQVYNYCINYKITNLFLTTKLAEEFLKLEHSKLYLTHLVLAGEKVKELPIPRFRVINEYGPTEGTVCATQFEIIGYTNNIPIGLPISNTKCYILDNELNPLPVGAIGELYIGGVGLARGYLNRPDLTAEKFIANPFQNEEEKRLNKNSRIYKTGDLVRWLPDGNLEYIGRNDFQVKIRGYRIELGEIENVLLGYKDIKQSVVLVKGDSTLDALDNKYLVGYYVSENKLDEEEIRSYLYSKLPEYMIPSILVHLRELPLTINGKLDRKALPDPEFTNKSTYVAPCNELEEQLCQIWADVLNLPADEISIHDDFFRLGGDSILAIRLISKLNRTFSSYLKVKDLFELKSIYNISKVVFFNNSKCKNYELYTPFSLINLEDYKGVISDLSVIEDIYPASYLQTGMLLESNLNKENYHSICSCVVKAEYNEHKLLGIWEFLVNKHELLRAKFTITDFNGWSVIIYKNIEITYYTYRNHEIKELIEREKLKGFDFSKPGLFKLIMNDRGNQFDFVLSLHHAIEDGWSIASLLNEFVQAYIYDKPIIPNLSLRYGEFVKNELSSIQNQDNIDFWQKYLNNVNVTKVRWKFDNDFATKSGLYISSFNFDNEQVKLIYQLAKEVGISVDCIFLLAYLKTLEHFTNNANLTIGLVVNNRLEKEGGDELFGLFLNTIPFHVKFENNSTYFVELVRLFNNKLNVQQYKQLPYGYIKSLFKQDLYDFVFNFVHFHALNSSLEHIESFSETTRTSVPFILDIYQYGDSAFSLNITAHDSYVNKSFLDYFCLYYKEYIINILNGSTNKLSLTDKDYKRIVYEWNQNSTYLNNRTIHQLFEDQVKRTPYNTAVIHQDKKLTYMELNNKANQLAGYLRGIGIKEETLITISMEKGFELIICLLGVLKAGAAYIPLDPQSPKERLNFILEHSGTEILLTTQPSLKLFSIPRNFTINVLTWEDIFLKMETYSSSNLANISQPQSLSYLIYTSGSTGEPKGVCGTHQGIINRISWSWLTFPFGLNEVCCQKTSLNFVDHVAELFSPLLQGVPIVLLTKSTIKGVDITQMIDDIFANCVTRIVVVPSLLSIILEQGPTNLKKLKHLKYIFCSGEAITANLASNFYKLLPWVKLINIYGASEVSADVTYYSILNQKVDSVEQYFNEGLKKIKDQFQLAKTELITTPFVALEQLKEKFRSTNIPIFPVDFLEYSNFLEQKVLPYAINTASPNFIGHMTSVLPSFSYELSSIMNMLNQNVVKVETSKSLTFLEREAIAMLHSAFYNKPSNFYEEHIQNPMSTLGVIVSNGTLANITALWVARNHSFPPQGTFKGVAEEGIDSALKYYGYQDNIILTSPLIHYSIEKAASLLGIGKRCIYHLPLKSEYTIDIEALQEYIITCHKEKKHIMAIVGIAGATETGTIDPLAKMAEIAKKARIYFHVDAAFGGPFIFSDQYKHLLNGIELADSITICGHKQLYLPMGISLCLFQDASKVSAIYNIADYQAMKESFDSGKYSLEGSRPATSLLLHASLYLIGKKGYEYILKVGMQNAYYLSACILKSEAFELINEPIINIVNYRYIPKELRKKAKTGYLSEEENNSIDMANTLLQNQQFQRGKTFISKTKVPSKKYHLEIVILRAVFSNPLTTNKNIDQVLEEQLLIAAKFIEKDYVPFDTETEIKHGIGIETLVPSTEFLEQAFIVPIGKPITNTQVYVLNERLNPLPVGAIGELYIGGVGLARGYLNRPDLTAEKFIANPFQNEEEKRLNKNSRIYKTGDLVRWLPDGNLEYIGRNDFQVKIRGYRIELGEIENVLLGYKDIKQSVVLVKGDSTLDALDNKYLVGYYVSENKLDEEEIRSYLYSKLPEYMIPSILVHLRELPLTINGKLDRKALPDPEFTNKSTYVAPCNELEEQLCQIWADVLNLPADEISIHDSFFKLGGNSILAIRLVSKINNNFTNIVININDFYNLRTLGQLATYLKSNFQKYEIGREYEF